MAPVLDGPVVPDGVRATGSTYRSKGQEVDPAGPSDDARERMMAALSEKQALQAAQALERAFPGLLRVLRRTRAH